MGCALSMSSSGLALKLGISLRVRTCGKLENGSRGIYLRPRFVEYPLKLPLHPRGTLSARLDTGGGVTELLFIAT